MRLHDRLAALRSRGIRGLTIVKLLSIEWIVGLMVACALLSARAGGTGPESDRPVFSYAPGRKLCDLANLRIRESSGLAASGRFPDVLWTHNDSGDRANIFAFDVQGTDLGTYRVKGAEATDWEDMAWLQWRGRSCLLLADVGNNRGGRSTGILYLVKEPRTGRSEVAELVQRVRFRFEDGPHDCEAVGFDPVQQQVLLVTKRIGLSTNVYALPWPSPEVTRILVAQRIATIAVPLVTGMDVSRDGSRAVLSTYGPAYGYVRCPEENWRQAFSRPGRRIATPFRRQGEAICFGQDGHTLYLTSEQHPTPLFEIRLRGRNE